MHDKPRLQQNLWIKSNFFTSILCIVEHVGERMMCLEVTLFGPNPATEPGILHTSLLLLQKVWDVSKQGLDK